MDELPMSCASPLLIPVQVCFSVAEIKHWPKAAWDKKDYYVLHSIVCHWGNWEEGTWKKTACLLAPCDLLHYLPDHNLGPGMALLTVDWALWCQLAIKKMPHRHAHSQSDIGNSLIEVPPVRCVSGWLLRLTPRIPQGPGRARSSDSGGVLLLAPQSKQAVLLLAASFSLAAPECWKIPNWKSSLYFPGWGVHRMLWEQLPIPGTKFNLFNPLYLHWPSPRLTSSQFGYQHFS